MAGQIARTTKAGRPTAESRRPTARARLPRRDRRLAGPGARRRLGLVAIASLGVLGVLASAAAPARSAEGPASFDREGWGEILRTHTRAVDDEAGTRVDYPALARDDRWRALVDGLATARPPRDEAGRMAFWIDVYNLLAIDMVVRSWPVDSIRDIGSFFRPVWGKDAGRVAGRVVTLHEIEHEILRPMGDPRIHMAIVCASTSCPSLAREPYDPARLDALLDAAVERFLADPRKGLAIDRERGIVKLSRIFDWFEEDFDASDGVRGFLTAHLPRVEAVPGADRRWLASERSKIRIEYFDYDWQVNALRR